LENEEKSLIFANGPTSQKIALASKVVKADPKVEKRVRELKIERGKYQERQSVRNIERERKREIERVTMTK